MNAMVEATVRMIMAAKISGPRLWVSHGVALAQILWVEIRASVQTGMLAQVTEAGGGDRKADSYLVSVDDMRNDRLVVTKMYP